MQIDERSQDGEELFVNKDILSSRACAPSLWHSKLVLRQEPSTRALGLRHDVFNRIGIQALQPPRPSESLLQVVNMSKDDWEPDLESEEEPSPVMMNHAGKAITQAVAWVVIDPRMRKNDRQEANRIGTQGPTTCGWLKIITQTIRFASLFEHRCIVSGP